MNRRGFLGTMIGGVAAGAAVRTFPFRVFSFPTEIKIPAPSEFPAWMFAPESYLYNRDSAEELGRLMGMVEKEKPGLNSAGPRYPFRTFRETRDEDRLFENIALRRFDDVNLAKVDFA